MQSSHQRHQRDRGDRGVVQVDRDKIRARLGHCTNGLWTHFGASPISNSAFTQDRARAVYRRFKTLREVRCDKRDANKVSGNF